MVFMISINSADDASHDNISSLSSSTKSMISSCMVDCISFSLRRFLVCMVLLILAEILDSISSNESRMRINSSVVTTMLFFNKLLMCGGVFMVNEL